MFAMMRRRRRTDQISAPNFCCDSCLNATQTVAPTRRPPPFNRGSGTAATRTSRWGRAVAYNIYQRQHSSVVFVCVCVLGGGVTVSSRIHNTTIKQPTVSVARACVLWFVFPYAFSMYFCTCKMCVCAPSICLPECHVACV